MRTNLKRQAMFFKHGGKNHKNTVSEHPTQLYLELSTLCNLSCLTCVRNSVIDFQAANFTLSMLDDLIKSISAMKTLKRVVLLGYGEALCNPHIHDILRLLGKTGLPLCLVTNGQLLSSEFIDILIELPVHEVFISWDEYGDSDRIRIGSDTGRIRAAIGELRRRRNGRFPLIGTEIVALRSNRESLRNIASASVAAGGERIIVTNVFPYSEQMNCEALFAYKARPDFDIRSQVSESESLVETTVANQVIGDERSCPFIEKGTLFVTAQGDVAPCIELAHTHTAWYFNARRTHFKSSFGNIMHKTLSEIWALKDFADFRERFAHYDFPDCLKCSRPYMCRHRMTIEGDCFRNGFPCGECLWARGAVRCP
jgi:Fe-coproporphyrin III synthase